MKRILITTVLAVGLLGTYEYGTLPAAELGLDSDIVTQEISTAPVTSQLLARGFRGGGGRRGGGGFRRGGGGGRRGGGFRRGGGGARRGGGRSGGYRSARSSRSGGSRHASTRRSSGRSQTRHASSRSSRSRNARSNHRTNNHANTRNRNSRNGRNGGGAGGGGAAWDAGALVDGGDYGDYGDYLPDVVPVVPDIAPVVVDPQPAVITLVNPADTRTPVYYNLGGSQYVLEAGQEAAHGDATQVITFDRGGSFGMVSYTLQPGTYEFVATNAGWDLHTVTQQVAADTPVTETASTSNTDKAVTSTSETAVAKESNPLTWAAGR
jgi:hypothetical protein